MKCCLKRWKAGFTLVEIAIVMGVVGVVGGAIWYTASQVKTNQPIVDSVQLVTEIATRVRGIYTGFRNAAPPTTAAEQIARGFFPESMVIAASNEVINPWNGDVIVNFPAGALDGFSIQFDLPNDAQTENRRREICTEMVTRLPGTATNYAGGTTNTLPNATPPLDPSQAGNPSLVLVNRGGWRDVTGEKPTDIFPAGTSCTGFAFYFRL